MPTYTQYDEAANSSAKILNAPKAGAHLKAVRIEFTATVTVGSRLLVVRYRDHNGKIVWSGELDTAITASQVITYNLAPNAATVAPVDGAKEGSQHIEDIEFNAGWDVEVIDRADIAALADDMIVRTIWQN